MGAEWPTFLGQVMCLSDVFYPSPSSAPLGRESRNTLGSGRPSTPRALHGTSSLSLSQCREMFGPQFPVCAMGKDWGCVCGLAWCQVSDVGP